MEETFMKRTIRELREIATRLEQMDDNGVDYQELDMIARQEIEPLVVLLKDIAYEARRARS